MGFFPSGMRKDDDFENVDWDRVHELSRKANRVAIVVGEGANELEIPCMVFPSIEQATQYVKGILGEPNDTEEEGVIRWYNVNFEDEKISNAFFKSYYGGCGDCFAIQVKEIEFGVPLVGWDLD